MPFLLMKEYSTSMLRDFFFDVHGYRVVGKQSVDRRYLISRTIQSLHMMWREQQETEKVELDPDDETKPLSIAYMLSQFKESSRRINLVILASIHRAKRLNV